MERFIGNAYDRSSEPHIIRKLSRRWWWLAHGIFLRSSNFLHSTTWVNPPMIVSAPGGGTTANIAAVNNMDFGAVEQANVWNGLHAMTPPSNQIPLSVSRIIFLKLGARFINNIYLD